MDGRDRQLEGVVEGDGGVAQCGGKGEGLEELIWGRRGRPGDVEVVHDGDIGLGGEGGGGKWTESNVTAWSNRLDFSD